MRKVLSPGTEAVGAFTLAGSFQEIGRAEIGERFVGGVSHQGAEGCRTNLR